MTKINVTNSISFVTDLIAMSHNSDMKNDVAVDMESEADVAIDVADDVAADISNTAHELMGRIQSGPPSWAWFQA